MNDLQIFNNEEFGQIRTATINNKIYFCGNDIAMALGYKRPNDAIRTHCRATVKHSTPISGKMQEINFIPEGDVYRLIVRSKLPTAEKFEHWVFDDVLPTIRESGGYVNNDDLFIQTYLPYADEGTKLMFRTTLGAMRNLSKQLEEQKPYVEFAKTVQATENNILVRECSKLASNYIGIDIGEKRLYQKLRDWKMVLTSNKTKNEPSQLARDLDILVLTERAGTINGNPYVAYTTKVTPKGQIYIINKLIKECENMEA